MTATPDFWTFAVDLYGRDGVSDACIELQNRLGADVNLVLFCIWLGARGAGPENLAPLVGAALAVSRQWQNALVEPLRTCRRNLKDIAADERLPTSDRDALTNLRERVKACELEAERMQIAALARLVAPEAAPEIVVSLSSRRHLSSENLGIAFAASGVKLDPLGQAHVMRILAAAFGAQEQEGT